MMRIIVKDCKRNEWIRDTTKFGILLNVRITDDPTKKYSRTYVDSKNTNHEGWISQKEVYVQKWTKRANKDKEEKETSRITSR